LEEVRQELEEQLGRQGELLGQQVEGLRGELGLYQEQLAVLCRAQGLGVAGQPPSRLFAQLQGLAKQDRQLFEDLCKQLTCTRQALPA
jgi:hypothetical protein